MGEGAFGAVWLARCRETNEHVALKEVQRQVGGLETPLEGGFYMAFI